MSLRMRLTWALVLAALGPMLIVVGATLLRTQKRAEQEAAGRLDRARLQARILIDRHRDEAMARLEQAAAELSQDLFAIDALLGRGTGARVEGAEDAHEPTGPMRSGGARVEPLE